MSELEVIGISPRRGITDEDISKESRLPHTYAIREGSRVLLSQSGRERPDAALLEALAARFSVCAVSGMPERVSLMDFGGDMEDGGGAGRRGSAPGGPGGPGGGGMGAPGGGAGMGGPDGSMGGGRPSGSNAPRAYVNTVERLDKAFRLAAVKTGADTVLVVWDRSEKTGRNDIRAAIIDVATGKWTIIEPCTPEERARPGDPATIRAIYERLAQCLASAHAG